MTGRVMSTTGRVTSSKILVKPEPSGHRRYAFWVCTIATLQNGCIYILVLATFEHGLDEDDIFLIWLSPNQAAGDALP